MSSAGERGREEAVAQGLSAVVTDPAVLDLIGRVFGVPSLVAPTVSAGEVRGEGSAA